MGVNGFKEGRPLAHYFPSNFKTDDLHVFSQKKALTPMDKARIAGKTVTRLRAIFCAAVV